MWSGSGAAGVGSCTPAATTAGCWRPATASAEANELRARLSVDEIRASYRLRQVEGSLFELHSIARTFAPSKRFLGETLQPILDEPASSESDAGAL